MGVDFGTTNSAIATADESGAAHLVAFPSAATGLALRAREQWPA
jgi:molecular chaperone DnaK (HSP70)